jgi:cell wall-associated NlpC family hydrolase
MLAGHLMDHLHAGQLGNRLLDSGLMARGDIDHDERFRHGHTSMLILTQPPRKLKTGVCVMCDVSCVMALVITMGTAGCATRGTPMAVNALVSDLRAEPGTKAQSGAHDPLQETQLLYGERVLLKKRQEGWSYVEAAEQAEFTHAERWQGYPGWVPDAALVPWEPLQEPTIMVTDAWAPTWLDPHLLSPSPWKFPMGTKLRATDMGGQLWRIELLDGRRAWMRYASARSLRQLAGLSSLEKRLTVLHSAQQLVGGAYYWGGRSPGPARADVPVAGVDCSGLVNLAFRTAGVDIPRDAHEQFLRAQPVAVPQPADLVFLSERDHPTRIVHVMLYVGDGDVIEGPGTGQTVRRIALTKRLARPAGSLASGTVVEGQTVTFGSYVP